MNPAVMLHVQHFVKHHVFADVAGRSGESKIRLIKIVLWVASNRPST